MVERTRETSNDSWPRSSDLIFYKLGYLQATCDRILSTVTAMQTPPKPTSGSTVFHRLFRYISAGYENFEKLHKLFTVVRAVRWGSLGWTVYGGLRWLGVM